MAPIWKSKKPHFFRSMKNGPLPTFHLSNKNCCVNCEILSELLKSHGHTKKFKSKCSSLSRNCYSDLDNKDDVNEIKLV